jgi:integrase
MLKGGKTSSIQLPGSVWKLLLELRPQGKTSGPVFVSRKKRGREAARLGEAQVWRIVRKAAQRAGIELNVSPHWMRHAHGSHALDRGTPIHLVQATFGHSSIATTGKYLPCAPQRELQPLSGNLKALSPSCSPQTILIYCLRARSGRKGCDRVLMSYIDAGRANPY